ncbi:helix-turn-helix domain-containing protein [Streptomyces goshikiensis]
MDRTPHGPSCAKRLRQEATTHGESCSQIAFTIHAHCSVSLLRAHRLARGLTLKEAAEGLNALTAGHKGAPRVDADQLGHWETDRQPRPATLVLLCHYYGGLRPEDLGFESAEAAVPASVPSTMVLAERALPWPAAPRAEIVDESLERQVDAVRRSVDRTLAAGTVNSNQLDLLDEQVMWAREQYVYTPPAPMVKVLLDQLEEVESLAADRQPAAVQVRLSELTAILATLVADALMKLGYLPRSRSWYATARHAADDSGNTELRARVRAQAAMLPFYYGPGSGGCPCPGSQDHQPRPSQRHSGTRFGSRSTRSGQARRRRGSRVRTPIRNCRVRTERSGWLWRQRSLWVP